MAPPANIMSASAIAGSNPAGRDAVATGLPAAAAARAATVISAITAAAERTGTRFEALFHTARLESGFNPEARARSSSATGLFQFIDSTWLSMLERHGKAHGLHASNRAQALELRKDPLAAALMAAEHMADNGRRIAQALGREADATDLYLAHFLGPQGAVRFLSRLAEAPDTPAASLFPRAAGANRPIFFQQGLPRSLAEVHALFARRLGASNSPAAIPDTPPAPAATPVTVYAAEGMPPAEVREATHAARLLMAMLGA
jgi:hypothetical protein